MKGMSVSPANNWRPTSSEKAIKDSNFRVNSKPNLLQFINRKDPSSVRTQISSFSLNSSNPSAPPLVVVGSANADIYVEIERLPIEGETISAKSGQTLAGGKGANQAACGGKLAYPTYFVGQVGKDAHGKLIAEALENGGVHLDRLTTVSAAPTGHAVVMLQPDGQNSIIIVGGANMNCWPENLSDEDMEIIRKAGIVLLQREIPDSVNIQVAKAARSANVPVILDAGGMEGDIPRELLSLVDIFSPNESELGRLTGLPAKSFDDVSRAVEKCHEMGVKQVLVKLGEKGSALFIEGEEPIVQSILPAKRVVDTTGAGDTFTASFAVAVVEGKSMKECMKFAAAAASLCVQVKGAIPSMPDRSSVLNLLQSSV